MKVAFAHYSSADDISGVTSWLIQLALRQDGIEIFKSPTTGNLRQHVELSLGFLNLWQQGLPGEFNNLANPDAEITILDLAHLISKLSKSRPIGFSWACPF